MDHKKTDAESRLDAKVAEVAKQEKAKKGEESQGLRNSHILDPLTLVSITQSDFAVLSEIRADKHRKVLEAHEKSRSAESKQPLEALPLLDSQRAPVPSDSMTTALLKQNNELLDLNKRLLENQSTLLKANDSLAERLGEQHQTIMMLLQKALAPSK